MPKQKRTNKSPWTNQKLETLYDCWKQGENTKERIALIEKQLPGVPLPVALSAMRKLAKTDSKWVRWATRKNNEKERLILEKNNDKERKKTERDQKRIMREEKREVREEKQKDLSLRESLRESLDGTHYDSIAEKIPFEFFFCPDVQQFVSNHSCIFRVFSIDREYEFSHGAPCDKCKRMDKYVETIKELVNARKRSKKSPIKPKRSDELKTGEGLKDKAKETTKARTRGRPPKSSTKRTTTKSRRNV